MLILDMLFISLLLTFKVRGNINGKNNRCGWNNL